MSQRSNIILLLVIPLFGILYLAYVWPSKKTAEQSDAPQVTGVSPRHSADKTRAKKAAELEPQSKSVLIDVNARLQAIYAQYPELAIEQNQVAPLATNELLNEQLGIVFPQDGRDPPTYTLELIMVDADDNNAYLVDAQTKMDMIQSFEHRITGIIEFIEGPHDLRTVNDYFILHAHRFLTKGYEYYLTKGDLESAASIHRSLSILTNAKRDLNAYTIHDASDSIETIIQVNHSHFSRYPEFISSLPPLTAYSVPTSTILKKSFPHYMKSIYENTLQDSQGNYMTSYELTFEDPFADHTSDTTDDHSVAPIPIEEAEEIMVKLTLNLLDYTQAQKANNHESLKKYNFEATLPKPWSDDDGFTQLERRLADISGLSNSPYLNAYHPEANIIAEAHAAAIQIAAAQFQGIEWNGKLPLNLKTGTPITWDKENNLLLTGLEGEYTTIKIPVAE